MGLGISFLIIGFFIIGFGISFLNISFFIIVFLTMGFGGIKVDKDNSIVVCFEVLSVTLSIFGMYNIANIIDV